MNTKQKQSLALSHTFAFALGVTVRDALSGLQGTVIGRFQHMASADQFLVQPPAKAGQAAAAQWIEAARLAPVRGKKRVSLKAGKEFSL